MLLTLLLSVVQANYR